MHWLHSITATYDPEVVLPLDEVKRELDVTHDDDDLLITGHRDSALQWVEEYISRFLGPKSVAFVADRLPASGVLSLPFAPVTAIASITVGGEAVAGFSSIDGAASMVLPPAGQRWPTYTQSLGAVRASYTAGYPLGTCPPLLLQAAKLMAGIFYDRSRDPEKDEEAVKNLIRSYRYGIG